MSVGRSIRYNNITMSEKWMRQNSIGTADKQVQGADVKRNALETMEVTFDNDVSLLMLLNT